MRKRFSNGFTLIEMIIIITVIAILARIVMVSYSSLRSRANDTAVRQDLTKLADALNAYYAVNNRYPVDQASFMTISNVQFSTANYTSMVNGVLYCVDTTAGTPGQYMTLIGVSKSGSVFEISDETKVGSLGVAYPSGTVATDCQNGNSSITSSFVSVGVYDSTRADSSTSSNGWLTNVL